jgi:5-formyltetrahydrofolate cyclo-ligase
MAEGAILSRDSGGKAAQRRRLQAMRAAIPVAERMSAADAVADHVGRHPAFARPGYVAGYWATRAELPLHALQLRLRPGQLWCLPVVQSDGSLRFGPWRPGDPLVSNRYGIPEPDLAPESLLAPDEMSLVLVPLLGFDAAGYRLGAGGGYYDRSFAFRLRRPPPPTLLGVGYACQEIGPLAPEPWDVPLDALASERGLRIFERDRPPE